MNLDVRQVKEEYRYLADFFNHNYGYCYLESMHYLNRIRKPKTIVTGISYALDGVDTRLFDEFAVSFAMHSQDLYYDYLHAKMAIDNNPNVENCVIALGYYSLFYDMSLASTSASIPAIQYHLFHDVHNMKADTSGWSDYSKDEYNEHRKFAHSFFEENPSYYGPVAFLDKMAPEIESLGGWSNLNCEQKHGFARNVAEKHNRHIAHEKTYHENVSIFNHFLGMLKEHNIAPYIVIMPFSKEYLGYINPDYKKIQLEFFEKCPYQVDYLDLNETELFEVEDFLDHAHVNSRGAQKVTYIVEQLIKGNI